MIDYNQIIGSPVLVVSNNKEIGKVKELIINFETGKLLGFQLSEGLLKELRVLRLEDVKEMKDTKIFVDNDISIKPLHNFSQFEDLLKKEIKIKDNNVVTESGRELGTIVDFSLDEVSYKIDKLFVKNSFLRDLFKGKLIISFDKIISISKSAIVVKDDFIKDKISESIVEKVEHKEMVSDVAMKDIE